MAYRGSSTPPNQMTIIINETTIEIKKLPLGRYAELLKALRDLPKKIGNLGELNNENMLQLLPEILVESWPEAIAVMSIATGLEENFLNEIGLDDAVNICTAVIEVNNYKDVYEKIKKMTARPNQISQ